MSSSKIRVNTLPSTSMAHKFPSHLQNRLLVTPTEAGACVGWAPQTVYNKLNENNFPIPLVDFNRRRMVRVADLVSYIEDLKPNASISIKQSRRPGRPTKAESIRRKLEKKGVAA